MVWITVNEVHRSNCRWWNSTNVCKSIVGVGASQLQPYSMCQLMSTVLYTFHEVDTELRRFDLFKTNPELWKIWSCRNCNEIDQTVKLRVLTLHEVREWFLGSTQQRFEEKQQCLSQLLVSIRTDCSKEHDLHQSEKSFNVEQRRGKSMNCRIRISKKRFDNIISK